jgi:hypothetical protein
LFGFATNSFAYHLEYTTHGDLILDSWSDSSELSFSMGSTGQDGWIGEPIVADAYYSGFNLDVALDTGEVFVSPDISINHGGDQSLSGGLEFMIVSDYGNLIPETVAVHIDFLIAAGVWEYGISPYFDSIGDSFLTFESPGIGYVEVQADKGSREDWSRSDDAYELLTNTNYTIYADLGYSLNIESIENPVPVPGAVWLLGTGLLGIIGVRRKMKK